MTVPMKVVPASDIMESVLLKGDLAKLTPDERVRYYGEVCKSLGLNPLTKPFEFINLNGKLQLYALRACADQLRKINGVSLEIVSREIASDVLTVHVRAKLPDGRCDEDLGAVSFPETLRGEARANAELKAVTKAKRRATLSICGLGWLDETEVEDIPASAKRPVPATNVMEQPKSEPPHDPQTGEITDWIKFGQDTIAAIKAKPSHVPDPASLAQMEKEAPKVHKRMMAAINKLAPAAQPLPKDDPEAYLNWLRDKCSQIKTAEALSELDLQQQSAIKEAFPPDQNAARGIIAARAREIAE